MNTNNEFEINDRIIELLESLRYKPTEFSRATVASGLGISKDVIAQALGHSSASVTDVYIDFDIRRVDDANRRVLRAVKNPQERVRG